MCITLVRTAATRCGHDPDVIGPVMRHQIKLFLSDRLLWPPPIADDRTSSDVQEQLPLRPPLDAYHQRMARWVSRDNVVRV